MASDQRQRLFDAVATAILRSSRPLVLVAEDAHWWDRDSLQVAHYLLRSATQSPLLVVATCRLEEVDEHHPVHELRNGMRVLDRLTDLPLERFSRNETAALVARMTADRVVASAVDDLFDQTEGNPLFIVEAVRGGWHTTSYDGSRLSPKVQAVIESRLARLSQPALTVARVAATIGREFTTDVVATAAGTDPQSLLEAVDELWRRGIVREQGVEAYDFSHDKIRDVAYQGLSPAQRAGIHLAIAKALERVYADRVDSVSAELAFHYESAGASDEAIWWYSRAADAATGVYANAECIRLLRRALDLLATAPPGATRALRELELRTALLAPLGAHEGYASTALAEEHNRALSLTDAARADRSAPLLRSLAIAHLTAGRFAEARECGEALRRIGDTAADDVATVEAAYVLGIAAFWQSDFESARTYFEAAVHSYLPEHRATHLARYVLDPQVICMSRLANTWWFLGRPDTARQTRDAALVLAEDIGHPATLGTALVFAGLLAIDMGELDRVRDYTTAANAAMEHQWRPVQVSVAALNGLVQVLDGHSAQGIATIQALLNTESADHAPGMRAGVARVLVAACDIAGDASTGLAAAEQALTMAGGALIWEPEIRRLRTRFAEEMEAQTAMERGRNAND